MRNYVKNYMKPAAYIAAAAAVSIYVRSQRSLAAGYVVAGIAAYCALNLAMSLKYRERCLGAHPVPSHVKPWTVGVGIVGGALSYVAGRHIDSALGLYMSMMSVAMLAKSTKMWNTNEKIAGGNLVILEVACFGAAFSYHAYAALRSTNSAIAIGVAAVCAAGVLTLENQGCKKVTSHSDKIAVGVGAAGVIAAGVLHAYYSTYYSVVAIAATEVAAMFVSAYSVDHGAQQAR